MSDYTPSPDAVRLAWAGFRALDDVPFNEGDTEFDRMVAQVRAEAWDEGATSAFYCPDTRDLVDYPDNPYRKEQDR